MDKDVTICAPPERITSPDLTSLTASCTLSHTFDFVGVGTSVTTEYGLLKRVAVSRKRRKGREVFRTLNMTAVCQVGGKRGKGVERIKVGERGWVVSMTAPILG